MKKCLFVILSTLSLISCISYTPILTGDCVGRAVKIRQELKTKGYETELVLGLRGEKERHCWVRYKDKKMNAWKEIKNYQIISPNMVLLNGHLHAKVHGGDYQPF